MDKLKIFIAGHGMHLGRDFLVARINEIENLHTKAHELHEKGYKMRKILKIMFGGESFIGAFTRGGLSRGNLVNSLLNWELEK